MRYYSLVIFVATTSLFLKNNLGRAEQEDNLVTQQSIERDAKLNQPDEAFLEFLASMSEVDGELTDPLDMVEITDSEMFDSNDFDSKKRELERVNQDLAEENK